MEPTHLTSAKHGPLVPRQQLDVVPHPPQLVDHGRLDTFLKIHGRADIALVLRVLRYVGRDAETRRVKRLLRVEVVMEHVEEDLYVSLRLHEGTHHAVDCASEGKINIEELETGRAGLIAPMNRSPPFLSPRVTSAGMMV